MGQRDCQETDYAIIQYPIANKEGKVGSKE